MTNKQQEIRARKMVNNAVMFGRLTKSHCCELCGWQGNPRKKRTAKSIVILDIIGIEAHHHNGYDDENALNVWWVCRQCNMRLVGFHDGSLTKEEAKCLVAKYKTNEAPPLESTSSNGQRNRTQSCNFRPWDIRSVLQFAAMSKKDSD